ncbi:winged helix-turn-helix domain-containing protein [Vibrio coralliirubri]|uniref:winged helix-turn-helix domain-containing protein n=1 Tax=Vibrio coralliirubri TaxID=1516159 RepID=UPI0006345D11|nr:winged helix-turn-helix domain-containing protein [Vibrio coralliirubri]CDT72682.1 Transcriptional activator of cad operon [Vibrio coralliirubri]
MLEKNISFIVDEWLFMPNEGQIQFADSCITIDNRLTKLLEFLCLNPGLTHTRDELIEEVWNGSVLTDQVVTQAVFELRKVLKTHSKRTSSYIVTVPKRGYRFDGEVKVEKVELQKPDFQKKTLQKTALQKPEQLDVNERQSTPEAQDLVQREGREEGYVKPSENSPRNRKLHYILAFLAVVIVLQSSYMWFSQNKQSPSQASSAHSLSHYEFRYVVLNVTEEVKAQPELYGIVIKLIEHIGFYSNIRVVKSDEHKKLAAIEFNISTAKSSDGKKTRLLVKYVNRASGGVHLNRRYSTNFARFHETFAAMIDDLLRAMYIDVPEEELKRNISVFPQDKESVKALMSATGVSYSTVDFDMALKHFREARALAPDNAYAISVSYISEVLTVFSTDEENIKPRIKALNEQYSSSLSAILKRGNNPRVCEANAILALSQSEPDKALKILLSIPYNQHTPLTYLLMAKAEEARGNTMGAKELYLQATQNTSSPIALTLAGPLFFDSNLDKLIEQLQGVKLDVDGK